MTESARTGPAISGPNDSAGIAIGGRYLDRLTGPDGRDLQFDWRSNMIVDRCRHLLAGFMMGDSAAVGAQTLAFGRGDALWDTGTPPPPTPAMDALIDPTPATIAASAAEVEMNYLDVAGEVTVDVGNRLQIAVTVPAGTLPIAGGDTAFPLREFALFGSFGGADYMINYIRHAVIPIAAEDTFARTIRLVF